MSDYIKRDDALNIDFKIIVRAFENRKTTATNAVQAYADAIAKIPSEDVRPVVRGKWKPIDLTYGRNYYFCSACEETVDMPTAMGIPMFRYCPNCGADMMEES